MEYTRYHKDDGNYSYDDDMFCVTFYSNTTGELFDRFFATETATRNFIRRVEKGGKCTLVSYPNFN